jgi:hypothetical protein
MISFVQTRKTTSGPWIDLRRAGMRPSSGQDSGGRRREDHDLEHRHGDGSEETKALVRIHDVSPVVSVKKSSVSTKPATTPKVACRFGFVSVVDILRGPQGNSERNR